MVVILLVSLAIALSCSAKLQSGTESYREISRLLRDSKNVAAVPVSPCGEGGQECVGETGGSPVATLWDPPAKRAIYLQSSTGQPRHIALVRRNYLRYGKRSGSYETTMARQGFRVPPSSGIVPLTQEMSEQEQDNIKLRNFLNFFKHFDHVPSSSKRSSEVGEPEDLKLQEENSVSEGMEKRARDYIRFGKRSQDYIRFGKRQSDYLRFGKRGDEDYPRFGIYLHNKRKSDNYLRFGKRKNANFIRFGKKNDYLGIYGVAKLSPNEHSEEEEEEKDDNQNTKLNETNLLNNKYELNKDKFEKRTQNFIRFGKRSYDDLRFGRTGDFASRPDNEEGSQDFGEDRNLLEKRNFKNCVETFSQEMCIRLPLIMSLRNNKRNNFLRYGRKR